MARLFDVNGIPLFDIGTVLAGIYVGYNNANGVDVGTLDEVLKYGPTIAATAITSVGMLIGNVAIRNAPSQYMSINQGHIGIHDIPGMKEVEEQLAFKNIGKETAITGFKTALESLIGYGIGYAIAKFS